MTDRIETGCDLPENAIPDAVVEVCGYIDADGDWAYTARWNGDRPSTLLGLLALAEQGIIDHYTGKT